MITASGSLHPDWAGGQTIFCRELFVHNEGYIFPTGEGLSKRTFSGQTWSVVHGDNWGDYYKFEPWGIGNNPYNVRWTWDVFILEDQSVLIGGAIATDTLQLGLFRHLMRLLPDGSHDADFPIIEAMPQGLNTHISKIERASDGSWYVSGRFQGINGHVSPHIAHLTADFEVDTEFVSPFYYESIAGGLHTEMKLLDDQDRLWFSGLRVRLAEDPSDYLHLVRLLPDGTVDPEFQTGRIESDYPFGWVVFPSMIEGVLAPDDEEVYFLHGVFSHYNDTAQASITAINDAGYIQANYFQNLGPTMNAYDPDDEDDIDAPAVYAGEILEDGSILFGGSFSDFMGEERYSMVKLNQGILSTSDQERAEERIRVYPNPAKESFQVVMSAPPRLRSVTAVYDRPNYVQILDLSGRVLKSYPWRGNNGAYDISALAQGVYLVQLLGEDGVVGVEKIVVQ